MSWKPLFICGCPRSGTSALQRVFSKDERFAIGMERYYFHAEKHFQISYGHFQKDRFFDLREGDTFFSDLNNYNYIKDRFEKSIYRGDKIPKLYKWLDEVFRNMPDAKVLFIYRNIFDVAASYEARANNVEDKYWARDQNYKVAVQDWNESLNALKTAINKNMNILPISYERFFSNEESLEKLYNNLGIIPNSATRDNFKNLVNQYRNISSCKQDILSPDKKKYILMNADILTYRDIEYCLENQ